MKHLIDNINSTEDIKNLNKPELKKLAKEIREFILEKVSKTGGHVASNLGVVELTLALHKSFNSPEDKIIWDVGHQAYTHKIITGRRDYFDNLRKLNGISGFPKRCESPHDCFETGHSSTSISAGLGMALARDLKNEKHHVISVIGDGALTGGMAFEALNHAGHSNTNFMVILNDNEMSISQNVGGLSKYLNRLRSDPTYSRVKDDVESILRKIPAIGNTVANTAQRAKDTIRYFLVPGELFEELGFTYIGPVNGHDIDELVNVLDKAKKINGPIMIHTITKKGKGYYYSERYPGKFHGIGPFDLETGEKTKKEDGKKYSEIFSETIMDLGTRDSSIVAITAAMPSGTGLKNFAKKFPKRFFDVGIAEQHGVTLAAGLAANGMKPIFAVYSTFLQRGFDQIIHDVCIQNLPVVFGIDRAGIVGEDGETHHGIFDLSYLRYIPNLKILAPRDGNELRSMLKYAFKQNGPIAIRYPRGTSKNIEIGINESEIDNNRAEVLCHGKDICLLAVGKMVKVALDVSQKLKTEGIGATVINARFIKPLDKETILSSIKDIRNIITLEDNMKVGGFGSSILELLNENKINNKNLEIIGFPDKFIEHGSTKEIFEIYGLNSENVFERAKKLIESEKGV